MYTMLKLLILSLLYIGTRSSYALPPSTFGDALASAGELSNKLKETAAWKRFAGIARESDSINSLVRIIPQTTMGFVREVVNSFRQKEARATVLTRAGAVQGRIQKVKGGVKGEFYSFKGMRYGQPPVGKLRFRAPLPEIPWKGVRGALREGSVCPHRSMILDNFKGNEDCLFINVYTPDLPINDYNPSFPVMVWIHGGAFSFGSGNSFLYGADYLVPEGVVLVTFNYRLGPLGFLSVGKDAPGNAGLKDQILALKWVQENIAAFGGDPKMVTIFGQSAGSVSVHMLMMSPLAKGLFHRAIAQSGTALNPWAIARSPKERAFRLGEQLGCFTNNTDELLSYLRKASPQKIVNAAPKTITPEDIKRSVGLPFVPSIENWIGEDASNEAPVITQEPIQIMKSGVYNHVPLITGFNSHEAMLFLRRVRKDPNLIKNIDEDFQRLIPVDLMVDRDSEEGTSVAQDMRNFYLNGAHISNASIQNMMNLMTDAMFLHGITNFARLHATHDGQDTTWLYRFGYDGALGIYKRILGIDWPGACHGDELGYLFHFGVLNIRLDNSSAELQTLSKMTRMWTNFAKYGNPTPFGPDDPLMRTRWPCVIPHTMTELPYLDITTTLTPRNNPEQERLRFWDETFTKYNGDIF
ncbi:juvenile hormone esterase [Topomyia yanbarensis]|uniref:juvenile hormone esterase n=1 Tax=Topomyia yanbarensis TaxID=2498891 RepID=UPI00273B48B8|nr:juvenile hormone esterase [Topomyia yanbarensis]XP_058812192.1 juvenile hormone esterase [Topomyia yanbarensis]XP_058812193.1 juvenile hormone esterase [Topomyia yanbarensis]XP_058812194.1 juvenile hormone esterase [Topomyia yanbarensis]XP_058812195.1 juvenile hormone esterase [Topomyia yanbarensis]XP_058812196.1 juvenile hormone esterase [Topomyia yanbarensis]